MSVEQDLESIKEVFWGDAHVPGVVRRLERIEDAVTRMLKNEEHRSQRQDRLITALVVGFSVQFLSVLGFLIVVGLRTYLILPT